MSTVFFTGWESGDFSDAGGQIQGAPTVQSAVTRNSAFALRVNVAAGVGTANSNVGPVTGAGVISQANVVNSYFRFDFLYKVKPTVNDEIIFNVDNIASLTKFSLTLNSSGNLSMRDNAVIHATGTTVLAPNTWYTIQALVGSGTTGAWAVLINGTPEISGTNDLTTNTAEVRIGKTNNLNSNAVDFYYDNFFWSDSGYPSPGICVALLPVVDGFYANGTPNGAAARWQCVDVLPPNSASYINGLPVGVPYTSVMSGGIQGIINSVKTYDSFARDNPAVACHAQLWTRSGTTDVQLPIPESALAAYVQRQQIFDTDPNTGQQWGVGAVNALQVGIVASDFGNIRVDALAAMVDYLPVLSAVGHFSGRDDTLLVAKGAA
jgi:hypothetical protein